MKNEQTADKIIKEMEEAGLTPDEMLKVIKLAKVKYEYMKAKENLTEKQ